MSIDDQVTPTKGGFFSIDRFVGIFVTLVGIWLLMFGIEMGVEGRGLEFPSPHLFPQIAAWIFIIGGILHTIRAKPGRQLPDLREALRYILVSILLLIMTWLMSHFGFLVGGTALLTALMFVVYEKRWLWIGVAIVALPLGTWAFFELLLQRPLP